MDFWSSKLWENMFPLLVSHEIGADLLEQPQESSKSREKFLASGFGSPVFAPCPSVHPDRRHWCHPSHAHPSPPSLGLSPPLTQQLSALRGSSLRGCRSCGQSSPSSPLLLSSVRFLLLLSLLVISYTVSGRAGGRRRRPLEQGPRGQPHSACSGGHVMAFCATEPSCLGVPSFIMKIFKLVC